MSSTHLSLSCHLLFSTHNRLRWIDKSWQDRLAQYIGGIVRNIEVIRKYIRNQREHPRKKSFQEKYIELLNENGIEFDEKYI
jgi:hypothetical protein